ncbi:MAG: hypothetical protein WCV80_02195 [Candidatus Paceibacterota bacterium]
MIFLIWLGLGVIGFIFQTLPTLLKNWYISKSFKEMDITVGSNWNPIEYSSIIPCLITGPFSLILGVTSFFSEDGVSLSKDFIKEKIVQLF